MKIDLPEGSLLAMQFRGSQWLWVVAPGGDGITGVGRPILPGETIYRAVCKDDRLEVRRTYVVQPGDISWEPYGRAMLDGKPVYVNRLHRRI
jgi:hypothetical protein